MNTLQERRSHEIGSVTLYACQYDQRFSYHTYIPTSYRDNKNITYSLAVIIHGDERAAQKFRGVFKDFAEATNTIILAPLFPAGIIDPNDRDNYKFIKYHDIRFDHVLLAMIDEVAALYPIYKDRFLLHGFSGGGQFVHRFFYLHPERLLGVSIGAPGRLTYLDMTTSWYSGIKDFKEQFGKAINLHELTRVPVQMIVGKNDTDPIPRRMNDPLDANRYGHTRVERLQTLRDNFKEHSITVDYVEVPEVKHEPFKLLSPVKEFFTTILKERV
ncbi:alpha/beta hydrolase [bacterium LRH843]|nr:alpha/beta hydrolase [bacterium LRH843]